MFRRPFSWVGAVLLLLTFGLLPQAVIAADQDTGLLPRVATAADQGEGVTMTVTPYLEGHVKYGEWLPLRVGLVNNGGDLEAEVRAEVAGNAGSAVYAVPVPLPAGARKEVDLYVMPPTYGQSIAVRLVQGNQLLAEAKAAISPHPHSEYLIGILASDADAFALLSGLALPGRSHTQLLSLSLQSLPNRAEALRSLDSIILSGLDTTSLTPAQGEALRIWVELGGRLLIGGGAGARRVLAGLPDSLKIIQPGDMVELSSLDGLGDFVDEPLRVPGPFLATFPADYQGWPLAAQDGRPLLLQRTMGDGWIAYLALDPAASPFDAWVGTLTFWQRLLEPGSALRLNVPQDIPPRMLEAGQMTYALTNLPELDLPSIRWLALLLGLYILLVGPVNYVLLRRLRRLDWAWITIPALTVAFAVGGYGLGYGLRGSDLILNQISVIPISPEGGRALVRSYVGLVSPSRETYNLRVGGGALVSAISYDPGWVPPDFGSLDVLQGDPALVRGLGVNQWSMQSFQAETWLEDDHLVVETDLVIDDGSVHGSVRNGLEWPLRDVIFIYGYRYARLGDLNPGESREIEVALQGSERNAVIPWAFFEQYYQGPNPPPRDIVLRQSVLEAYFNTNWGMGSLPVEPTLLAWTDFSPLEVGVVGAWANRVQTTLVVARVPPPVGEDDRVSLPTGFMLGQTIFLENDAGECGFGNQIYVNRGRAVLEYQVPAALYGLNVTKLLVQVGSTSMARMGPPPTVSLYDWTSDTWMALQGMEEGHAYSVADPGRFMHPVGGAIRLQIADGFGICYRADLGLEGELPGGEGR